MNDMEIRLRCLEIAASLEANVWMDTDEILVEAECLFLFVSDASVGGDA